MPESGQRVGEYVLVEKIGEGGFGQVWKAKHAVLDDVVAVKIPTDSAYIDQLRTEGRLQRALKHPGIVQTLGLDPGAATPYFVMEYVAGGSLREHLRRRGPLPHREASDLALQILDALSHAHEQGVVHRDIKPENILLVPGPRPAVKISDFGLGRISETVSTSLYLSGQLKTTEGKTIAGTLDYMAPEQKRGLPVDARCDVYAFGLVFYEMLMGELPVGAFRYPADVYPDIPLGMNDFLRRCLAPTAAERFVHAGEAAEALRRLLGGDSDRRGEAFVFGTGLEVHSVRELVDAVLAHWETGRAHLYGGQFEPWLRAHREKELSRRAAQIRAEEPDGDVGLQMFLEATGMVASPRMDLDTTDLVLGEIPRGETRAFQIHIARFGRGVLWGEAVVQGAPGWVTPPRVFFKGERTSVEFAINTTSLSPGVVTALVVNVQSNGGSATVAVRFRVGPRPALLEVPGGDLHLTCPRGSRATGTVRVRNGGDAPLSLSASWNDAWVEVDRVHDLAPGEERDVRVTVRAPRVEGPLVTRVTLVSNGGSRELFVRVTPVSSFTLSSLFLGLLVGAVPFIAEILGLILMIDAAGTAFGKEPKLERRSKLAFLAGLLPGILWHLWLIL